MARQDTVNPLTALDAYAVRDGEHYNFISIDTGKHYYVQDAFIPVFMQMCNIVKTDRPTSLHIAEVPDEYCRLVIDIDLSKKGSHVAELYDRGDVIRIVKTLAKLILDKTNASVALFYYFEKPPRLMKKGTVKHGFHLMTDGKMDYKLRRYICEKKFNDVRTVFIGRVDDPENTFDIGVLDNPWLVYGAMKAGERSSYMFTSAIRVDAKGDVSDDKIPVEMLRDDGLIQFMSINNVTAPILGYKSDEIMTEVVDWFNMRFGASCCIMDPDSSKEKDIMKAMKLVDMIDKKRTGSLYYADKMRIARALKGISNTRVLMNAWIAFVRKGIKSIDDRKCVLTWNGITDPFSAMTGMSILASFARRDSPDAYAAWKKHNLAEDLVSKGELTHFDVARLLEDHYSDRFKFDPATKKWYERMDYYWKESPTDFPRGISLIMSDTFTEIYRQKLIALDEESVDAAKGSPEVKRRARTEKAVRSSVKSLGNRPFKKNALEEASTLMSDENFSANLDSSTRYLIFQNGYLDLENIDAGLSTEPCDTCMSHVINYPYIADDEKNEAINAAKKTIMENWEKIFPVAAERDFVLLKFAAGLRGNQEQEIVVLVGPGSAGKSTAFDFYTKALDCYAYEVSSDIAVSQSSLTDSPTPYLAKFRGKRVIVMAEMQKKAVSLGFMKWITGSSTITARLLHQNPVEFAVTFKIFIDTNYPINLQDRMDYSNMRRYLNVPTRAHFLPEREFKVRGKDKYTFVRDDRVKLLPNQQIIKQAFMCILITYYKRLVKGEQIKQPPFIQEYNDTYMENNHSVCKFMKQYVVKDEHAGITISAFFAKYKEWYFQEYGKRVPVLTREEVIDVLLTLKIGYDAALGKLKGHRLEIEAI